MSLLRPGFQARVVVAALAAGLVAAAAAAALAMGWAGAWERDHQRQRLEALLAVAGPDLGSACFLEDRSLAERAVEVLMRSPDLRGAVLRTPKGILAEAARSGRGPDPDLAAPWVRSVASPFAREVEVGQLALEPETGEVRRRAAAAALLAGASALAAALALVAVLALALGRQVARPLEALARQAGRSEAGTGGSLDLPPGHRDDPIGRLVQAFNGMVKRVAGAAWMSLEAGSATPRPRGPETRAAGAVGVVLVRQDGALEAWTPLVAELLATVGRPPKAGVPFPALFGPAAAEAAACLAECGRRGRAAALLALGPPGAAGTPWVHLDLEQAGPGWVQGALQDAAAGMTALARAARAAGFADSGPGQEDPHPGALHGR